ncbi:fibrinogen-like protein 1 [Protopterus annectens]|uniref:fibrinogen-like protein 1 n=1 Tax=Protopterus annectens TaxID=7888 RepID=UPI001CFAC1DC|nr:fibrinogen-like protein 1 [Protopterus annectens]
MKSCMWLLISFWELSIQPSLTSIPDCSDSTKEDPACLDSLVAMPPSDQGCSSTSRLPCLSPDEQEAAVPEELKELRHEIQEFRQTFRHADTGGNQNGKQQSQTNRLLRNLLDRLGHVESSILTMVSRFQKLHEEARANHSSTEERLNALVILLLNMLSECDIPCNASLKKLSLLESRWLKTSETKEDLILHQKGTETERTGYPVDDSEKLEKAFPRDCAEIYRQGIKDNGIYTIQPVTSKHPFEAFCDMITDGGGWTVFQRRQDGSVEFNQTWQEYKQGFGNLEGEHWLGNENVHSLTKTGQHMLRIELEDWYGVKRHAIYHKFKLANEQNKYRLTAREYSGNAGNALSYSKNYNHDHKFFSTTDSDNDNYSMGNCGTYYGAGWWFDSCLAANLNGKYYRGKYSGLTNGIYWGTWYILTDKRANQKYSFKRVEMKTKSLST